MGPGNHRNYRSIGTILFLAYSFDWEIGENLSIPIGSQHVPWKTMVMWGCAIFSDKPTYDKMVGYIFHYIITMVGYNS